MRKYFAVMGIFILGIAFMVNQNNNTSASEIIPVVTLTTVVNQSKLIEVTDAVLPTEDMQTPTHLPLMVDGFILKDTIDLTNSKSTVMAFYLPNGNLLTFPTWASAVSEDVADITAFEIHRGTIYSLTSGEANVTLLHSGMVYNSPDKLAGANFERYVTRESAENNGFVSFLQGSRLLTVAEGMEKANTLIGSTGYICQKEGVAPFIVYTGDCQEGRLLQVRVKVVALISGEQSMQYDWLIANGEILPWLQTNFPGFDSASPRTGFLISTCIHQFADQLDLENLEPFLYNRLGIWLEIVY